MNATTFKFFIALLVLVGSHAVVTTVIVEYRIYLLRKYLVHQSTQVAITESAKAWRESICVKTEQEFVRKMRDRDEAVGKYIKKLDKIMESP